MNPASNPGLGHRLSRTLRRARVFLSVHYAHMLEYRAELVFWMLAGLFPFILMGVWVKASESGQLSLDSLGFARYFLAVFLVRQFTVVWVIWDFEREIVEGKLSPFLLHPIDPVWRHVARHIAERFARAPFLIALLVSFFVIQPHVFWIPEFQTALTFLAMVAMAFSLRFTIQYTFAMFCFWTERASSLQDLWFLLYLFLSGMIAPLSEYPESVRAFVYWTPFPYLVNVPASLLAGTPVDLPRSFAMLAIWLCFFIGLNRMLWKMGLKHYSGMGA